MKDRNTELLIQFAKDNGGKKIENSIYEYKGIVIGYFHNNDNVTSILIEIDGTNFGWRGVDWCQNNLFYTANRVIEDDKEYSWMNKLDGVKLIDINKDEITNLIKALDL